MDDFSKITCPNPECKDYKVEGKNNIFTSSMYGKHSKIRLLYCQTCGQKFSERKGTPIFNTKLDNGKIIKIVECILKGYSIRRTCNIAGVNKMTVCRFRSMAEKDLEKIYHALKQVNEDDRDDSISSTNLE